MTYYIVLDGNNVVTHGILSGEVGTPHELIKYNIYSEYLAICQEQGVKPVEKIKPPEQVANWKLEAILEAQGYMEVIQPMIDQSPSIVQKAWNDAPMMRRASPMILEFADRLDLTDEEVDELFTEADKIQI